MKRAAIARRIQCVVDPFLSMDRFQPELPQVDDASAARRRWVRPTEAAARERSRWALASSPESIRPPHQTELEHHLEIAAHRRVLGNLAICDAEAMEVQHLDAFARR